jgi:hypothetical protein
MSDIKPIRINLDPFAHDLLQRAKRSIQERNLERAMSGQHDAFEGATFKDIVQRGIALVAAEVIDAV